MLLTKSMFEDNITNIKRVSVKTLSGSVYTIERTSSEEPFRFKQLTKFTFLIGRTVSGFGPAKSNFLGTAWVDTSECFGMGNIDPSGKEFILCTSPVQELNIEIF